MTTTYILGAGASVHAGYPLAKSLGDDLVRWLRTNPTPANELHGSGVVRLHEVYGSLTALEAILTELEHPGPGSRAAEMSAADRRECSRSLRIMIPEFFRSLRTSPAPLYEELASRKIRAGDAVITFNYDVALERQFKLAGVWEISDGYGFSLGLETGPATAVEVLKLHGSVNWMEIAFGGLTHGFSQVSGAAFGSRPAILDGEFDFLGYDETTRDRLAHRSRAGALPAIIMPTFKKRFHEHTSWGRELTDFWDDLWHRARAHVLRSERLVIVGYSFPKAD